MPFAGEEGRVDGGIWVQVFLHEGMQQGANGSDARRNCHPPTFTSTKDITSRGKKKSVHGTLTQNLADRKKRKDSK